MHGPTRADFPELIFSLTRSQDVIQPYQAPKSGGTIGRTMARLTGAAVAAMCKFQEVNGRGSKKLRHGAQGGARIVGRAQAATAQYYEIELLHVWDTNLHAGKIIVVGHYTVTQSGPYCIGIQMHQLTDDGFRLSG